MARTRSAELHEAAVGDLAAALANLGMTIEATPGVAGLAVTIAGHRLRLRVRATAYLTRERVSTLGSPAGGGVVDVVVADRITEQARQALSEAGWNWFDRRGHLRLIPADTVGIAIDRGDLQPLKRRREATRRQAPLTGLGGRAVAYALLTDPATPLAVRRSASRFGLAPSTVSAALADLRRKGLIDAAGRPILTELFWELADAWPQDRTWLRNQPKPTDAGIPALDAQGPTWRLTGLQAAIAWGAPAVAANPGFDLYVPGPVVVTIAVRTYERAAPGEHTISIAVAPVRRVAEDPWPPQLAVGWPLAHPVAVALELAQDRGRGRDILSEWSPPEPYKRVWD
jgi:hypothetical protein